MTKIAAIAANIAAIRKLAPDFPRKAKQEEGKTVVAMLMCRCSLNLPSLEQVLFGQSLD
jgi:hypothetical protein